MCLSTLFNFDCSTWMSLVGLLHPQDFVMTANYTGLWQRHVAWAKPKGEDLRTYITQQYATSMVLMSLMLTAQVNVFFNSSDKCTDMRRLLEAQEISYIRYWIGWVLIMDACMTLLGLVVTFSLWGIIAAISNRNAHCLLRSSLGQYVTSLPPRFVVSALYLFLLWMFMFMLDIIRGPIQITVMIVVFFCLFQSVVVPLSAFGRLVMHTGAMAQKPVLRDELEKELLPSGLQASLLLRATSRYRQNRDVSVQYRRRLHLQHHLQQQLHQRKMEQEMQQQQHQQQMQDIENQEELELSERQLHQNQTDPPSAIRQEELHDSDINGSNPESDSPVIPVGGPDMLSSTNINYDEEVVTVGEEEVKPRGSNRKRGHERFMSVDTAASEFPFPIASVLNAATSGEAIRDLIETSLRPEESADRPPSRKLATASIGRPPRKDSIDDPAMPHSGGSLFSTGSGTNRKKPPRRARRRYDEWAKETDVRDLYGVPPPADLPVEITLSRMHGSNYSLENLNFDDSVSKSPTPSASRNMWFPAAVAAANNRHDAETGHIRTPSNTYTSFNDVLHQPLLVEDYLQEERKATASAAAKLIPRPAAPNRRDTPSEDSLIGEHIRIPGGKHQDHLDDER